MDIGWLFYVGPTLAMVGMIAVGYNLKQTHGIRHLSRQLTPSTRLVPAPLCRHLSSAADAQPVADVQQRGDHLSITVDCKTFKFSYMWLRDHCRCPECYEHTCNQNLVNIFALPTDIKPTEVTLDKEKLYLTWPDGHLTTYSMQWLLANAPGQSSSDGADLLQPLYWDRDIITANPPQDVHIDELRSASRGGLRKCLENLHVYGFTFVSGLEASKESTEEAVQLISNPMNTFYGSVFQYHNDGSVADTGHTSKGLQNHTDGTYFMYSPGGAVLHCLYHDGTGGENTLVDGYAAARRLRAQDPDLYEALRTIPVVTHFRDEVRDLRCNHHVFTHDVLTNQLEHIRFNPHDRLPLNYLSYEDAERFYAAYRALGRIINSSNNEVQTKLRPGRMLIFDNWRLIHGRVEFTGKRVMVSCFLSRDELQDLKRVVANLAL
ncbi:trimethyllysine dioxygenase, mitochondrial-like [Diadema antillarum]|uniref:trimethyllysine dioxygenase, mitochondrial-like n=1 Tax=Diadema antillarum TaxID=105358 RepID=UPI003A889D71